MLAIAWLFSSGRRQFPWRIVLWGLAIQFSLGLVFLGTSMGQSFFDGLESGVTGLQSFINAGARFVFGDLMDEVDEINLPADARLTEPALMGMMEQLMARC